MLIPLASGSFLATFWAAPPESLPPGKSFSFTGFLAVGSGDVASVQKVVYAIDDERTPVKTGTLSGRVREAGTGLALSGVNVVVQDANGNYVSSARTGSDGTYVAWVPPGRYRVFGVDADRSVVSSDYADVSEGEAATLHLELERSAYLSVDVRDGTGRRLPAKISIEAVYEHEGPEPPRTFLYDLKVGERFRPSDLDPDTSDSRTRRYLERYFYAPKGTATHAVRPGRYKVYASRGIEYELASAEVELAPGEERQLAFVLNHVMPTPGWVSGDFHVHSANSVDSHMALPDRVASYAVEGVDYLASTDHNFVSDFAPTVEAMGLEPWVKTSVGLELTTLEMGHFNAFPLVLDPGPVTHGSFNWFRRPPGELFAQLRCPKTADNGCIGHRSGKTLVQVNHPRDSIMGYFSAFNLGAYTGTTLPNSSQFKLDQDPLPDGTPSPYDPRNFTLEFDLLEVFNGKHLEQLHHYRMPAVPPPGPEPKDVQPCTGAQTADCLPPANQILETIIKVPNDQGGMVDQPQPVYPGALEDFYTLVGKGRRIVAVGNSDSHGPSAEAGLPRTYVHVGPVADGSMQALPEEVVLEGLKAGRVVVTNGPFLDVTVNGQPVGSDVVSKDGTATVRVVVRAPSWIDVRRVVIKRGGKDVRKVPVVLEEIPVPPSKEVVRLEVERTFTNLPDESFIVVEASGDEPMWPVYTPAEIKSILINEAVGAVGAAFGFGSKWGKYRPEQVRQVTPFAFTNPIRVVHSSRQPLTIEPKELPLMATRPFSPRKLPDLRRLFGSLHSDVE